MSWFLRPSRPPRPAGFSLLEVVLALALTVLVFALIGSAVQFHARRLDVRQTGVEEMQLARVVLHQIAADLRSVIVPPPDSTIGPSGSATSTAGGTTASGAGQGPVTGAGTSADATASDTAGQLDPAMQAGIRPGIYGTSIQLQIDTSRALRFEEYGGLLAAEQPAPIGAPNPARTVSYAVVEGGLASDLTSRQLGLLPSRGLIRQVFDRNTARWAAETAVADLPALESPWLVPEVAAIEFAYFDGLQWTAEWNTEQMQTLPQAVEIRLVMHNAPAGAASVSGSRNGEDGSVYSLVVYLPAAKTIDEMATELSGAGSGSSGEMLP